MSLKFHSYFTEQRTYSTASPGPFSAVTTDAGGATRGFMGVNNWLGEAWTGLTQLQGYGFNLPLPLNWDSNFNVNAFNTDPEPDVQTDIWIKFTAINAFGAMQFLGGLNNPGDFPGGGADGWVLQTNTDRTVTLYTNQGTLVSSVLTLGTRYGFRVRSHWNGSRYVAQWWIASSFSGGLPVWTSIGSINQGVSYQGMKKIYVQHVGSVCNFQVEAINVYTLATGASAVDAAGLGLPPSRPATGYWFVIQDNATAGQTGPNDGSQNSAAGAMAYQDFISFAAATNPTGISHRWKRRDTGTVVDTSIHTDEQLATWAQQAGDATIPGCVGNLKPNGLDVWMLRTDVNVTTGFLSGDGFVGNVVLTSVPSNGTFGVNSFTLSGMVALSTAGMTQPNAGSYPNVWQFSTGQNQAQAEILRDGNTIRRILGTDISTSTCTESGVSYPTVISRLNQVESFWVDGSGNLYIGLPGDVPTNHTYQRTTPHILMIVAGGYCDWHIVGANSVPPNGGDPGSTYVPACLRFFGVGDLTIGRPRWDLCSKHALSGILGNNNAHDVMMFWNPPNNTTEDTGRMTPVDNELGEPFWGEPGSGMGGSTFTMQVTSAGATDARAININTFNQYVCQKIGTSSGFATRYHGTWGGHLSGGAPNRKRSTFINCNFGGALNGVEHDEMIIQNCTATEFQFTPTTGGTMTLGYSMHGGVRGANGFVSRALMVCGNSPVSEHDFGHQYDHCTVDFRPCSHPSNNTPFCLWSASTPVRWTNSIFLLAVDTVGHTMGVFDAQSQGQSVVNAFDYNLYVTDLDANSLIVVKNFNDGSTTADRTFAQWQALGFDLHSRIVAPAAIGLDASYRPLGSSPAIRASSDGMDIGWSASPYPVGKYWPDGTYTS